MLARRAAGLGSPLNGQISAFSQPACLSSHGFAAVLPSLTPAPADLCSSCLPGGRRETVVEGLPDGIMPVGNSRKRPCVQCGQDLPSSSGRLCDR